MRKLLKLLTSKFLLVCFLLLIEIALLPTIYYFILFNSNSVLFVSPAYYLILLAVLACERGFHGGRDLIFCPAKSIIWSIWEQIKILPGICPGGISSGLDIPTIKTRE